MCPGHAHYTLHWLATASFFYLIATPAYPAIHCYKHTAMNGTETGLKSCTPQSMGVFATRETLTQCGFIFYWYVCPFTLIPYFSPFLTTFSATLNCPRHCANICIPPKHFLQQPAPTLHYISAPKGKFVAHTLLSAILTFLAILTPVYTAIKHFLYQHRKSHCQCKTSKSLQPPYSR